MWREVSDREAGKIRPSLFTSRVRSRRVAALQLSNRKEIVSPHRGAVNSIQVDLTEGRYLLSGSSDASVAIYDIQQASDYDEYGLIAKHRSLVAVDKHHEQGHKFAISSAIWYPIDTGLFVTGSYDHDIKVWDTNTSQAIMEYKMPGKVYGTAMSSIATTHMLIAAGSADVQVRLCDIASGAFTHTLSGHHDGVMTLEWSSSSEWVLMTGGCDGAIRFWDIRRAGCFLVLDQLRSQLGRRPALSVHSLKNANAERMTPGKNSAKAPPSHKRVPSGSVMKNLNNSNKHQNLPRGSATQRLHPGMSSSLNRATAHYGAVTGLKSTKDGIYLISSGSDSRLRLWDVESGCNTLVNFEAMRLQTSKPLQLAISHDSSLVFVPCMSSVKAYHVWSGVTFQTLRGHYESVNCCYFNYHDQEIYTGSNDRKVLVWSPFSPAVTEMVRSHIDPPSLSSLHVIIKRIRSRMFSK
ncbi:WD repeat-containing protein ATCSA-1 isoform X1 [Dendrobium catenatum]|uniref:Dynein assembly factor with WDR repeat domains 1 n=1 Tax=Dendrobium catenatum TaxID=906689 RepID=A0A2I0WAK3_9ASPA|nr:WD repeat-containing protein ATCSA-1 isoform X1 [Dendrobium catenatum]PKU72690.1 Dynein assembly factor with WDR repeat domains 1 [Dendrobium catenatum]